MNTNIAVISVAGNDELAKQIGNLKPNEEVELVSQGRFKELVGGNATFMLESTEIQTEESEEGGTGIMGEMMAAEPGEKTPIGEGAAAVISALNPRG